MALPVSNNFRPVVFYNKKLFDQAGVQYPPASYDDQSWTWDKWLETARAVTKPDKDPAKAVWGVDQVMPGSLIIAVFGVDLFDDGVYATGKPARMNLSR